jgi:putative DNA primase/helicase
MSVEGAGLSLVEEGRRLVEQLGGTWATDRGVCRCPAHDDRNPSLSVRLGRSRLLLHCFAGCEIADILRALRRASLVSRSDTDAALAETCPEPASLSGAAIRLWGSARPIPSTAAQRYLAARSLRTDSPEIRFHPRTPQGPKPFTRFRPALIAAVRDETGLVAVHRTFLTPGRSGRAPTASAKSALGPLGRGAVRLCPAAARLGLAEGIETAMSASALFGIPCWATLGTERFRHVALPPEVKTLLLFLDNDEGGRRAEALAREAFPHLSEIQSRFAHRQGWDWNDVLHSWVSKGGNN